MASALDNLLATDMAATFMATASPGSPAQTLTHTAADGIETEFTGALIERRQRSRRDDHGQTAQRMATVYIDVEDVALPAAGDSIADDTETWTIAQRPEPIAGGAYWRVEVSRYATTEAARPNLRRQR